MANDFYNKSGSPTTSSKAVSSTMRTEFDLIETGFEKISPLTGKANLPVFINTGATAQEAITVSSARAKLGLAIGSDVQAYDAFLQSISALGTAANKFIYITGVNTAAEASLTAFGRSILDDADAGTVLTTLGVSTFIKTLLDDADAATARATIAAAGSAITLTAGTGISGGGDLTTNRTFNHDSHTGEVTGSTALTITNKAVTLAKMADMATASLIGRNTAATGVPEVLSKATVLSLLNVADGANAYVHPNHSGEVTSAADGAQTIANKQTLSATSPVTISNAPTVIAGAAPVIAIPAATNTAAGHATAAHIQAIEANSAKNTNIPTSLSVGTVGINTVAITSDGGANDVTLPAATISTAGMLTTAKWAEIVANTAKATNVTHTGEVTGSGALTIAADAVTYAKMQNVSATNKILGRSTAGSGNVEEIACTSFGRSLLDDANAAGVIATLGLDADIVTLSLPASTTISTYGKTLIDDADAATAVATLGITATAAEVNTACDGSTAKNSHTHTLSSGATDVDADVATLSLPANTTISTFGKTLIDDANAATALGTLGLTATAAEINKIDGFTGAYTDLNYAKDLKATGVTTTEFDRICDGILATAAEVNTVCDGTTARNAHVHSNITLTAGTGISGGGTLAANRTFTHTAHTGDVTGTTALTIGAAKVKSTMLKTSTQSQDYDIPATTTHNFTLTGGQYCFWPTIKVESALVQLGDQIGAANYATTISLYNSHGNPQHGYVIHRYMTSSGEINWLFILRDKITKQNVGMSIAPDHPCFGSNKPLLMPHPFGDYDETKYEIIVINPSNKEIEQMESETIVDDETKPDKDLLEVITENYEIDENSNPAWPSIPVTVGLPKHVIDKETGKKTLADYRFMSPGTVVEPIKKRIPKPDYIKVKKLKRE